MNWGAFVIFALGAGAYFFHDTKNNNGSRGSDNQALVSERAVLARRAIEESAAESGRLENALHVSDRAGQDHERQFLATVSSQAAIENYVESAKAIRLQQIADARRTADDAKAAKLKEAEDAKAAKLQEIEDAKEAKLAAIEDAKLAKSQEVSVSALSVQSHRYDGRVVVSRLNCIYISSSDYRCVGGSALRVDFSILENAENLEKNCDEIEKIFDRQCAVRVRFTYKGFENFDVNALTRITRVIAEDDAGEIISE